MADGSLSDWLKRLGYAAEPAGLHLRGDRVPESHPYAIEIHALLRPEGAIRAKAVFDIEGVPTVVFVGDDGGALSDAALDRIRKGVWNQNLASVVIDIAGDSAKALPARKLANAAETLKLSEAHENGRFSAFDIASANLSRRHPEWFDTKARVDRKLLSNLSDAVTNLADEGFNGRKVAMSSRQRAELLMGQVLFVSYLEHRDIVGATYRKRRKVKPLHKLISDRDREGVGALIDALKNDFNGDFLSDDRHDPWRNLTDIGFDTLNSFLSRTDMKTGQGDFWNYDFSFIPVELLSGMYETFLSSDEQALDGAFYTPRHLATLAIDQAFAATDDPLLETIFDGACGSGILLTTVYRRLIGLMEARDKRSLSFAARRKLLVDRIFGADINMMACRVTAFSLYLSLMEGLDPSDIMEAQERHGVTLPTLGGVNLHYGAQGDFFSTEHAFAQRKFSLLISNPPWAEPKGSSITSADAWVERTGAPHVRRQIAGAYALRALDFLEVGGRLCLILPITQFLGPTSADFVAHLLGRIRPRRLINFGDLQGLLFPTAELTCHVFVGERRAGDKARAIPFGETFDYCVPKADMSLAYGRLTMQSADRHSLQTISVAQDPQLLVTLMWGDASDLALWARLSIRGKFADFWKGPKEARRWICRKGVHLRDASRTAVSAEPLKKWPFVPPESLSAGVPVLHRSLLGRWPANQRMVVGLNEELLRVFKGPRVLFPDGFSRTEHNVRAVYFDKPATFTHSIGVIAGPPKDKPLLKFAAVYLRSSLARYFLMMRGWKMLCERNGVHLTDVETFPFFDPSAAPKPKTAERVLQRVEEIVDELEQLSDLEQLPRYHALQDQLDGLVFDYFGLDALERDLVRETVRVLMPSVRPRSYKSLYTPAQQPASQRDFTVYAKTLTEALSSWREKLDGSGHFNVRVVTSQPSREGPQGVVRIAYSTKGTTAGTSEVALDDALLGAALTELRRRGLSIIPSGDAIQLVPDARVWTKDSLSLVRPLIQRNWTMRVALRDAEDIVRTIQSRQKPPRARRKADARG